MSPDYAGDPLEISDQPKDYDGVTILSPTVGASADVAVFDGAGTAVRTVVPMVWNADRKRWVYEWDTTGVGPGNYRARVRVYDINLRHTRVWVRIRLVGDPITVST